MIDKKEISKASAAYVRTTWNRNWERDACMDGFERGADWAIDKFLKDLWHDASEEPKSMRRYIIVQFNDNSFSVCNLNWLNDCPLKDWSPNGVIDRYCYLDDILPQKGGKK